MIKLLVFFLFIFLNSQVFAHEQPQLLRHASFVLRGLPPNNYDLDKISTLTKNEAKIFLEQKIKEYTNSQEFSAILQEHVFSMLGLIGPTEHIKHLLSPKDFLLTRSEAELPRTHSNAVLNNFLRSHFINNKSWDQLFLASNYTLNLNPEKREYEFYQDVFNIIGRESKLAATTKNQQNALAGIITTPEFFERHVVAAKSDFINRNESIFKIFLCSNIQVKENYFFLSNLRPTIQNNKMHLLANFIVKHPAFAECQVRYFVNWFFDKNIISSDAQLGELTALFEITKRRPKFFTEKLFTYFYQNPQDLSPQFVDYLSLYKTLKYRYNLTAHELQSCQVSDLKSVKLPLSLNYYRILKNCLASISAQSKIIEKFNLSESEWNLATQEAKLASLTELAKQIIGPNVYSDTQFATLAKKLFNVITPTATAAHNKLSFIQQINLATEYIYLSEEFLSL